MNPEKIQALQEHIQAIANILLNRSCTGRSGVENIKLLLAFFTIANEVKHPKFYLQL